MKLREFLKLVPTFQRITLCERVWIPVYTETPNTTTYTNISRYDYEDIEVEFNKQVQYCHIERYLDFEVVETWVQNFTEGDFENSCLLISVEDIENTKRLM